MIDAWHRIGIQTRVTAVAVLAVLLALTVAAFTLVSVLDAQLTTAARESVTARATDIAAQIATDDKDAIAATIQAVPGDASIVQVLDPAGTVLYASPGITGRPALAASADEVGERKIPFLNNDEYTVAARTAQVDGQPITVLVGQSLETNEAVLRSMALTMAVAVPLLALAVGLIIWLAVGRSLTSVEHIRREVDVITSADLHQRVPVPPARDEIRELAQTMNGMLGRLELSSVQQRQFVADASHELKSPLASMRATLDTTAIPEPTLDAEVTRMTRLVEDLLTLARSDEGALRLHCEDVDLDDLLFIEASRLRAQTDLTVLLDAQPTRVTADPQRVAQIVRNLVDNAARYATTTVRLEVHTQGSDAVLLVQDDGPGIPQAQRQRVFDRFVRLDDARSRQTGGSGLGLAICRELVRLHGGTIEVRTSTLGGAQVRVSLPLSSR